MMRSHRIAKCLILCLLLAGFWAAPGLEAATQVVLPSPDITDIRAPNLTTQALALTAMAMMPFIIMLLTSFIKIVIVLSLLRNALGVQQSPPNQVINGVALMLSLFIMFPTGMKMYDAAEEVIVQYDSPASLVSKESAAYIIEVGKHAREPLRDFLKANSSSKHHLLFLKMSIKMLPEEFRDQVKIDDFLILIPAYITSQLKSAFEIGVLIYIPFFVVDLVTANILLAMGMMMLSPVTISTPLKLFLLVMLDAWTILIQGLVQTFVQ
jgi:type III secretion protein R